MKLKLSAGTQLAHSREGLGWCQLRPRHGLSFPQMLWARLAFGQTQVFTNAVTCLLLKKPIRASAPLKAESPTSSLMIYVLASLLRTRLTRINLTRRDMSPNPICTQTLCISARKRNTIHLLEQKYVCLRYQKGHSQVESLEEAALSPKLRSTACFKLRLFTKSRLHLFRFFYYNMGTFSAHCNIP